MLFMIAPQVATSILINVWAESVKTEGRKGLGYSVSMKIYSDASNGTNFGNAWQSPAPYLLGGVATMFLVITLAIIILACSCFKPSSSDGAHGAECLQQGKKYELDKEEEQDGKVVVIMAGDENPTFIGTPTPMAASI